MPESEPESESEPEREQLAAAGGERELPGHCCDNNSRRSDPIEPLRRCEGSLYRAARYSQNPYRWANSYRCTSYTVYTVQPYVAIQD
ncbi:hypothetical protein F2P81_016348 [Scophthalmus maximus]|uniref:Uncharacterized protein n=1 Tax=Scophthalmus maximus TaxID=52904 RepID=A0A6A4SC96_SCOMX|nr:hypothetical protein F2P81_016348 [Scophthalmus maximus]